MLCENEIENVRVNKKPSASYEEMIPIISDDLIDEKHHQYSLQNEDDLSLLSKAVDSVLSNHSNIKVTSLKNSNYATGLQTQESSDEFDNRELSGLISELKMTKKLISKKQTELEFMQERMYKRDKAINEMESQLYTALDKMLEFVVKYEKYIL